ncbi:MAG TPA: hypothetical protein VKM36_03810 [Balneolaceae bacterium]|nr:hypothetical protein [Balneolaceae bacterium]
MKKTLSILLSVLYVALLFAPLIPYAEYALHKEHIMLHYCENPDSDCEGACYLKKQVQHQHTDSALIVQHIFQVLFVSEHGSSPHLPDSRDSAELFISEDVINVPPDKLLQPPRA